MVNRKVMKRNALISVYDKSSLKKLCGVLNKFNIGIISTGATAKKIISLGFKCKEISNLTKFKEILDGRVKTLNPKLHASILYKRNDPKHEKTFRKLNFPIIDFVIVNFYPFTKISNKESPEKKIEMIDIGGPSMIRSASKNFASVTTICDKKFYDSLIKELKKNNGVTSLAFRKKMAKRNFKLTSDYDLSIFKWFNENKKKERNNKIKLKYGENPNQKAYYLTNSKSNLFNSQLGGKNLGYNNILDISDGLNCLYEFQEPTCVIIKHNNPCGIASANNIDEAYEKAIQSDPVSAFGGIVLFNKKINTVLAKKINSRFFEAIVAPKIYKKILETLSVKKKLIVINSDGLKNKNNQSFKSVNSGALYQEENQYRITKSKIKLVSKKSASRKTIDDLIFAYKVAKHVKSNAIVLADNRQTLGIGAGQMSRLDSTRMAILKYKDFFKNRTFVCASDAFFPFTDNIDLLLMQKCEAIIQPGGSINDDKIIEFAKTKKTSLYFIKNRVFKH
ncbi:bifunctional phosphoribosylaminoimidazolecarboxamide formyltransferase/IMP cyclohydrolase [Alphaproteobacteria bacterium]|jgi:phosphoribosylaminoimidazolecarboxamide formyltransferase / IMP cyclohydrolase|nr:bifunctional phosphoribosylaminoimidazolecarboxamide formyltransferase/IMP cyclohydrolase [Alphaproteobacteria bacterium]